MQIDVKLHGPLRDYLPREQRGRGTLMLDEGATIEDAISALNIKRPVEAALNSAHESAFDTPLSDGDTLTIFEQSAGG